MGFVNLWFEGEMIYENGQGIWLGYFSRSWPTVTRQIMTSRIEQWKVRKKRITYKPLIFYMYQVDSKTYISNKIEFTLST